MNLFLRLLWLALTGSRRAPVPVLGPCRTPFRVLPSDLDFLRHVNNGVYFSLMDIARVDLMRRAGMFAKLARNGWYPVVTAETMQFRRSLTLFQRFDIVTRVVTWDDRAILVEQAFERKGEIVALALVRARFLSRKGGTVPTGKILALGGLPEALEPPPAPERAARWNADFSVWPVEATAQYLPEPRATGRVRR